MTSQEPNSLLRQWQGPLTQDLVLREAVSYGAARERHRIKAGTGLSGAAVASKQPILVGQAVAHIVRGSFNRAVTAGLLAMLALTTLWIVAASLGRNATVRALLEYFASRSDSVGNVSVQVESARREDHSAIRSASFRSLLALNFLRATLALAAILGRQGTSTTQSSKEKVA